MSETPPVMGARPNWRGSWIWIALATGLIVAGVLFFFNPVQHGFYPRCYMKMFTGLDCPGCGGLRATHQLLHGHLVEAFQLNPLFICLLPLGAFFGVRHLMYLATGRLLPQPFHSSRWIWVLAGVVVAFGILRNLPWHAWFGS